MLEKIISLANGVEGLFIKNNRFNTTLISCNFFVPLKKETVASFGMLPFILTSCSKKYPDFSKLNYKLSKLYGARLDASTEKYGDFQLLKMTISVINDRFTLDGESLIKQATDLLLQLIFEPSVDSNAFLPQDIEREKRKAIEHIKSEYSEKRIYAKKRLIEEMYKNEPYGVSKCGTVEDVEKITGENLFCAWEKLLKTAFIRFQVVGAAVPTNLFEDISERFSSLERENVTNCKLSALTAAASEVNNVTETSNVNQGKLCLGFSSEMYGNDDISLPVMVMCDIFGGGPYSKLFSNVREKQSLCYYCSASSIRQKGLITVESGIELKNAQKAKEEILNQLDAVKNGDFTEFELESSIKSLCDTLAAYNDNLSTTDLWYALKVNNDTLYSPQDIIEKIQKITREDILNAAKGVNLHTVYTLLPKADA